MSLLHDERFLLIPVDLKCTHYSGYIKVKDEEFHVDIQVKNPPQHQDARFLCERKMKELLHGYEENLQKKLNQCASIETFLREVFVILENVLLFKSQKRDVHLPSSHLLKKIYKEIESVGWDRLLHLDENFQLIKLGYRDQKGRTHMIAIQLDEMESGRIRDVVTDLPILFKVVATPMGGDLKLIYEHFVMNVDKFQEFWDVLDEIDKQYWVLEPETPDRACSYRKVALGKNLSMHIKIDPYEPSAPPECKFIGAKHVVDVMNEKVKRQLPLWDSDKSLLQNLIDVLDTDIPMRQLVAKEDVCTQCGICYSYQLNNETPDEICDDRRCAQPYHNSCLVEWLRSRPSFRQSFNIIFGECPYCKKSMSVRVKK